MKDRDRIVVSREIPDYAQLVRASELGDLIDDLPPLPQNLIRAIDLLDQPDPDAARQAELLGRDPALTARLLRTANSPVYYRGTAVTTPAQAIAVMGLAKLKSVLVLACIDTLRQNAVAAQPEARILRETVWQNSLCTAVAARQIAAELGLPDAEESYVHGLLHDLGKLALLHVLPARYVEACGSRVRYPSLVEAETALLGISHPLVGAAVAHNWSLPVETCEIIRLHHEPPSPPPRHPSAEKAALVQLADLIAHHLGYGHRHGEPGLLEEILALALHRAPGRGGIEGLLGRIGENLSRLNPL
jgi:HD-like signal output (HDOD) protein